MDKNLNEISGEELLNIILAADFYVETVGSIALESYKADGGLEIRLQHGVVSVRDKFGNSKKFVLKEIT